MIYEKIAGEFGCVDGELTLAPGLNVVYAPNETGKSTWCALVRATLYGVESAERAKAGMMPVKTKYLPWSGKPAFGRITVRKDGRPITITRQTQRGRMFSAFSAVYADTNEPVTEFDATTAGEALTGVAVDVFTRSLFCAGDQMAVSENAELERKIAAIAGTGDDEISASAANKLLNSWKNERRHNKTGKLPQLEEKIRQNRADLAEISESNRQILAIDGELKLQRAERAALAADKAAFAAIDTAGPSARLEAADEVAQNAADRAIAFRAEHGLSGYRGDRAVCEAAAEHFRITAGREAECRIAEAEYYTAESRRTAHALPERLAAFNGCTAEFAREDAAADRKKAEELLAAKPKIWLFFAAVVAAAIGVALKQPAYHESMLGWAFLFFGCAAAVTLAGMGFGSIFSARRDRRQGQSICDSFGAAAPAEITALELEYERYLETARICGEDAEAAADKLTMLRKKYAAAKQRAEELAGYLKIPLNADAAAEAEALVRLNRRLDDLCAEADRTSAAADELRETLAADLRAKTEEAARTARCGSLEATEAAIAAADEAIRAGEHRRAELCGRLSHFADFAYLSAETAQLEEEHARLSAEYEALTLAMGWITESADELARRLTPKLCSRASELFAAMTGGKYGEVQLDKHFAAEVLAEGEGLPRSMLQLSRGALDQLYLAIRIALSEIFFDDALPPLVLDDCFAAFDDARCADSIALLAELSKDRQIVIFTCRAREADAAKRFGANVAEIA
ncbi:MAG: AAA family ATPase [Clostridia bacterium]|nr:AAA family ATPase [Clostridia bacterium]